MPTPINISEVSYNTYFGDVGKVLWFKVTDNFNYFELDLNITLQRTKVTNLQVYNNVTNLTIWENSYPEDVDQEQFLDNVRILNTPAGILQPLALINLQA